MGLNFSFEQSYSGKEISNVQSSMAKVIDLLETSEVLGETDAEVFNKGKLWVASRHVRTTKTPYYYKVLGVLKRLADESICFIKKAKENLDKERREGDMDWRKISVFKIRGYEDVLVVSADKNMGTVVVNVKDYSRYAIDYLSSKNFVAFSMGEYEWHRDKALDTMWRKIQRDSTNEGSNNVLSKEEYRFIKHHMQVVQHNKEPSLLKLMPKVHKIDKSKLAPHNQHGIIGIVGDAYLEEYIIKWREIILAFDTYIYAIDKLLVYVFSFFIDKYKK